MATHLSAVTAIFLNLLGFFIIPACFKRVRLFSVPLLALSALSVFLFFPSLFGWGSIAVVTLRILNILCFLGSVILLIKGKNRRDRFRSFREICPYLLTLILLFGSVGILSRYWELSKYDEYSNYRKVVQSLMLFGRKTPEVTHPEYPYGMALIQYYFSSVGMFHEHILLFANGLTFFCAMFYIASFAKKPLIPACLLCAVSAPLAYVLGNNRFPEIMLDNLIGGVFAAVLFSALKLSDELTAGECIERVILFAFFIQIKDACAAFLLVAFALILYGQFRKAGGFPKFAQWKKMIPCALFSVLPYLSWFTHIKIHKIENSHPLGNITLPRIVYMLTHLTEDTDLSHSFHMYVRKVFMEPFGTGGISIFGICLILFTIGLIGYFISRDPAQLGIALILFGGAIAYRVYVGLSYIFVLESTYPLTFNEFERFILSYLLAWALLVFAGLLHMFNKPKHDPTAKILLAVFSCFILIQTPWMDLFEYRAPDPKWIRMKQFSKEYEELLGPEDRTFTLFDNDRERAMLVSLLFGKSQIATEYLFLIDEKNWTARELQDYIRQSKANYVLVDRNDSEFWDTYGSLFSEIPDVLSAYHLYEVNHDGIYQLIR